MDRDTIITTIWVVCVIYAVVYFIVRKKKPVELPVVKVKLAKQILIFNLALISLWFVVYLILFFTKPSAPEISYTTILLVLAMIITSWWNYKRESKKRRRLLDELSQYPFTYEDQMVKALTAYEMGEDDVAQEAHARAVELQPNEGGGK